MTSWIRIRRPIVHCDIDKHNSSLIFLHAKNGFDLDVIKIPLSVRDDVDGFGSVTTFLCGDFWHFIRLSAACTVDLLQIFWQIFKW